MDEGIIGFAWGGFFATAALLVVCAFAAYLQSRHRVPLQAAVTALLTSVFVFSYLGWLPTDDPRTQLRVISHVGIAAASLLGLLLLLDLGVLREREMRRRMLRGTLGAAALAIVLSWMLQPKQALQFATVVAFGVAISGLAVSVRSAQRGDRVAWVAAFSLAFSVVLLGGLSMIALDRQGVSWQVHAISALAGGVFLAGIGAMLWLRYSYLIEVREVLAHGPRYDPVTRMRSNTATAAMVTHAFARRQHSGQPVVLIAVSIGNLYALENLHGRAALNHALFICAARMRRCVPAYMDVGRLFDDGFLLVSRNARDFDRLIKLGRRLAKELSQPVTLHTNATVDELQGEAAEWAAQVGIGLLATTVQSQAIASLAKVRDMSRTAWSFESHIAWHDQTSDTIAEVPLFDAG